VNQTKFLKYNILYFFNTYLL